MISSSIFGEVASYKFTEANGEARVELTINTSWSANLSLVLAGDEQIEERMEAWGINTYHALKGLRFAIDVECEFDEETGLPAYTPTEMHVITEQEGEFDYIEQVKRDRHFVPFVPDPILRYCAN